MPTLCQPPLNETPALLESMTQHASICFNLHPLTNYFTQNKPNVIVADKKQRQSVSHVSKLEMPSTIYI